MSATVYMRDLSNLLYDVLAQVRAKGNEANPQNAIAEFLRGFEEIKNKAIDVELEQGFKDEDNRSRETDIVARGVAFEVKSNKADLGTDDTNDAGTQIGRRLRACKAEDCGWATNGERWIRYARDGEKTVETGRFDIEPSHDKQITPEIRRLIDTLKVDLTKRHAPTREAVVEVFYPIQRMVNDLATKVKAHESYQIKFELWQEQLRGAHMQVPEGDDGHELFASHTLLTAAARLIAAELSQKTATTVEGCIKAGGGFVSWLDWEGEEKDLQLAGKKVCSAIYQAVIRYDWGKARGDILKHLYQDFIPSEDRHDFGEYYTPDWLAEKIVEQTLDESWCKYALQTAYEGGDLSGLKVLDPSCGSGTFLYVAAKRLLFFAKQIIDGELAQTNAVISLVYGFDIHPVAVELAHATLASAFKIQSTRRLNVYLGDALQMQTHAERDTIFDGNELVLRHKHFNNVKIAFPKAIVFHEHFGKIIDSTISASAHESQIENVIQGFAIRKAEDKSALRIAVKELKKIRDEGKDGIWAWFVRNLAEPYRLSEGKVGRIIGNPPWIMNNYWEGTRQEELQKLSVTMKVWRGGKLAPNNDLAALFVARAIQLYLVNQKAKHGGRFGFVLPASALKAQVWKKFRKASWAGGVDMSDGQPWLVETKPPVFSGNAGNACVVFGKQGVITPLPSAKILSGDWGSPSFQDIKNYGDKESDFWSNSPTANSVRRGACLFPHVLLRVREKDIKDASATTSHIKTCKGKKRQWRFIEPFEKEIENSALRVAVWSDALLPFRMLYLDKLIFKFQSKQEGENLEKLPLLAAYWNEAESIWRSNKTKNSRETLEEQVDYMGKLSSQLSFLGNPLGDRVIYNKSGTNISAAVLLASNQTIIDEKFYRIATRSLEEAHYLAAILNSDALRLALLASRNNDRDFDTLPFQKIPIRRYDQGNDHHATLAKLGEKAEKESAKTNINEEQTNKSRADIRHALRAAGIMEKIDEAVKAILPDYCA